MQTITMKLLGRLPEGSNNGLARLDTVMPDAPETPRLLIVQIDTKKLITDMDTGEVEPVARILAAEYIDPADDFYAPVMDAAGAAKIARVGDPLPTAGDDE